MRGGDNRKWSLPKVASSSHVNSRGSVIGQKGLKSIRRTPPCEHTVYHRDATPTNTNDKYTSSSAVGIQYSTWLFLEHGFVSLQTLTITLQRSPDYHIYIAHYIIIKSIHHHYIIITSTYLISFEHIHHILRWSGRGQAEHVENVVV